MNRRTVITSGALAAMGSSAAGPVQVKAMPIVRVSFGWYPAEKEAAVAEIMNYSGKPIEGAIKALPGLISYYSGIDRQTHTLVNVSLWRDTASATAMETLQTMIDQGKALVELGVRFERPIPNFTTLWSS